MAAEFAKRRSSTTAATFPDAQSPSKVYGRSAQLTKASIAPVDATAIPVEVTSERKQNALTLEIRLKPGRLGLAHRGGRWQGSIDVATKFASERPEGSFPLQFELIDL